MCASGRLHIQVLNHTFTCYYPNQEINISLMDNGWLHTGSLVCPDCQEVCEAGVEAQEPPDTGSRYVVSCSKFTKEGGLAGNPLPTINEKIMKTHVVLDNRG